jgi:hypothetical protein
VFGLKRRVKDYYLSSLWARRAVSHFVNHNALAIMDSGRHTGHYHSIALYGEPQANKNDYGDEDSYDDFTKNFHWQKFILS